MPPKRRRTSAPSSNSKKVRISDTTNVIGTQRSEESHASGRPKRSGIKPIYNFTRSKLTNGMLTKVPKSSAADEPVKRGRGRPPRNQPAEDPVADTVSEPVKRGRGRPKTSGPAEELVAPVTRGRGRPKVSASHISASVMSSDTTPPKRSPGRPPKVSRNPLGRPKASRDSSLLRQPTADQAIAGPGITKPAGRRGRPKKTADETVNADINQEGTQTQTQIHNANATKRGRGPNGVRGRPAKKPKISPTPDGINHNIEAAEEQELNDDEDGDEDTDDDKQYWLMKAEPETRYENGVDVSFSIDDLRNAKEPEGWDGVRSPVARNIMRAMKLGDLAFFYHSNCKVPGIAGIMSIAREHSTDENAFNPKHPYYDPKSTRENPKWDLVHVQFERKFKELITLADLKSYAKPGGALENLQVLRQARLSVSKVSPKEWKFIMGLAEVDDDLFADDEDGAEDEDELQQQGAEDSAVNGEGEGDESATDGAAGEEEPIDGDSGVADGVEDKADENEGGADGQDETA